MAFFNLTMLGPKDPFKTSIKRTRDAAVNTPAARTATGPPVVPPGVTNTPGPATSMAAPSPGQREGESSAKLEDRDKKMAATESTSDDVPIHPSLIAAPPFAESHDGSYVKHIELLHKHRRNPQGPNELYRYTLTSAQEHGRWMLDASPSEQRWSRHHRHAHVNSEMTRFVDEMSLTNKDFQLF